MESTAVLFFGGGIMPNNTKIFCDFDMNCDFSWEIVLEKAGFRNDNPFNSAIWSKQGLCDIAIHGMHFCVHPFIDAVFKRISPEIEEAICVLYDCKCSVEIGHEVMIKMWR